MIEAGIRQDNTWLVVDPIVGCSNNCQYCFLQSYNQATKGGKIFFSPEEAVEKLMNYWAFSDVSFPMIGSETDMFLNDTNIAYLEKFIDVYASKKIKNPLCISTKCHIPDSFIDFIKKYEDTKFIFYISYSGLPASIEPKVNRVSIISNFKRLANIGHNPIHLFRPITPHNSSIEIFRKILGDVSDYASCSVLRGLNLNPKLQEKIWFWDEARNGKFDFSKTVSIYPKGWQENLLEARKVVPDYPIFLSSSCAIAYKMNNPEFVGSYGTVQCSNSQCPEHQMKICNSAKIKDVSIILSKLGLNNNVFFDEENKRIRVSGELTHEQVAYISQQIQNRIFVESIKSEHEWGGYVLGHTDTEI